MGCLMLGGLDDKLWWFHLAKSFRLSCAMCLRVRVLRPPLFWWKRLNRERQGPWLFLVLWYPMVSYGHVLSSPLHQFRCPKWGWHYFCCQETLDEHCRDLVDQLVRSPPTVWRPSNSEKAQGGKLWTDATIHNMQKMIKDVSTIVNQQYNSVYIYMYIPIYLHLLCVYTCFNIFQHISIYDTVAV
jgi:hypothetical protein